MMIRGRLSPVLLLACLAAVVGCGAEPTRMPPTNFAVSAQVVDARTGRPIPPSAERRKRPAPPSASSGVPIFRKLEPIPETSSPVQTPEAPAPRQLSPEEESLIGVARERPFVPIEIGVNGESAVLSFVGGDEQCRTVAVTYPARRVAELWRVCAEGGYALDRDAEPIPELPADPALVAARQAASHLAYQNGRADSAFGELVVRAQSSGAPDQNGCMAVRNAVTWNGITIAMADETICAAAD